MDDFSVCKICCEILCSFKCELNNLLILYITDVSRVCFQKILKLVWFLEHEHLFISRCFFDLGDNTLE